jgi:O-antigen/teichoic acid export membrane protein
VLSGPRAVARRLAGDSLARNSVLIMASTVGTSGLGYLFWMVAARSLPADAVGAATALVSAATVVSMLSNLGIGHMFIQRLPGTPAAAWSRIVSGGLAIGCLAAGVASVAAAVLLPRTAPNFAVLNGPALVATAVALTASTLLDYVFVAHRASHGMFWRNVALAAGKVVVLPMLTAAGLHDDTAVLLAWTLPSIAVTAVTLVASPQRLKKGARLTTGGLTRELPYVRAALKGHHLINLAQAGPGALLPVLVTARLGAGANAHFYVAWMTASVLFMVSPAVASAFYAERRNAGNVQVRKAATVVLAVITPPAIVLFAAGAWILGLFSSGYAHGGGLLLKILVVAAVPDAITNLAVAHWRSRGEFRRCLHLNLVMAVTILFLTWLWLPGLGIAAAGLGWLAGQLAGALLVAVIATRRPRPHVVVRQRTRRTAHRERPPTRRKEASVR